MAESSDSVAPCPRNSDIFYNNRHMNSVELGGVPKVCLPADSTHQAHHNHDSFNDIHDSFKFMRCDQLG